MVLVEEGVLQGGDVFAEAEGVDFGVAGVHEVELGGEVVGCGVVGEEGWGEWCWFG